MPPAPIDTTALLREYCDKHQRAVERILASSGVPAADRPDLAQEVFLAAHRELRRTASPIERPGPWLGRVAIRRASNYHRRQNTLRLVPLTEAQVEQLPHSLESPEQRLGNCQLLALLLEEIDEEARAIVLAHVNEGRLWEEIAAEHGITSDRAKYLHSKALAAMEAALARRKLAEDRRGAALLPFPQLQLFESARADADAGLTPAEQQRRWPALAQTLDEIEILPARSPSLLGPALTFLLGGAAGFALCLVVLDRPSPAPPASFPPPSLNLVMLSPVAPPPAVSSSVAVIASAAPRLRVTSVERPAPAEPELDYAKLEQARVALAAGEP
ncbi:MAG: sigma-70 family RNA polymerase sigma factor, partial [Minicystis sp.]